MCAACHSNCVKREAIYHVQCKKHGSDQQDKDNAYRENILIIPYFQRSKVNNISLKTDPQIVLLKG